MDCLTNKNISIVNCRLVPSLPWHLSLIWIYSILHNARFHGYAYDGIWAIARAIEAVEMEISATNESLAQFEYK